MNIQAISTTSAPSYFDMKFQEESAQITENPSPKSTLSTLSNTVLFLLIIFPYISIPILFALFASINKESTTTDSAVVTVSFPIANSFSSVLSTNSAKSSFNNAPVALSLNSEGELQLGGGTTVYLNTTYFDEKCPNYLDIDSVFTNSFILSYYDKSTDLSYLSVVQIESTQVTSSKAGVVSLSKQIKELSTFSSTYDFFQLTVLDQDLGIFVFITQDQSSTSETAYVVAGKVDPISYEITIGSPILYTQLYSVDPYITRLSNSSFAFTYYSYDSNPSLLTRYGNITSTESLSISLSNPKIIGGNANYGVFNSIVGLTDSLYFILYYNSTSSSSNLNAILVNVTSNPDINLILNGPVSLVNSKPVYFLSSTRINNNTAIVTYTETYLNFGIRSVVISFDELLAATYVDYYANDTIVSTVPLAFGSSIQVTSGKTLTSLADGILMDIDTTTLYSYTGDASLDKGGIQGSIAVMYSDISNNAAIEVATIQLSAAGELIKSSAAYVLNNGNPNFQSVYSWGAISASSIGFSDVFNTQVVMVSSLTDIDCLTTTSINFSIMEISPSTIGISSSSLSTYSSKSTYIPTVLAGTVAGFTNLVPGMSYYSTSQGTVIPGNEFFGRNTRTYIDNKETGVIVSLDSYLGVAISSTTLLLQNGKSLQ